MLFSERQNDVVSAILISSSLKLIDRADRKLFKQIQLSHHCLNSLLPSSRFPCSRYSLRSRGHQFSLPQLNTVLNTVQNMFGSLIDVCFSIFSSIIPPRCICFFSSSLYFFSSLYCGFFFLLLVLKVRMSPLFIFGVTSNNYAVFYADWRN